MDPTGSAAARVVPGPCPPAPPDTGPDPVVRTIRDFAENFAQVPGGPDEGPREHGELTQLPTDRRPHALDPLRVQEVTLVSVPAYAASDAVSAALGFALDGLSLRQRTIADNIANIDTPDFRATTIDFESALSSAVGSGRAASLANGAGIVENAVDTPVGANGNNVDLRKETLAAMQSQFQYQMVTRAVTDRFDLVKAVAGAV